MTNGIRSGAMHVLLVEDNEGDVLLFRHALKEAGGNLELHVAPDGAAALEFVNRNDPRPNLVVMDLNLPGKTGTEVLQHLKSRADSREIPVVVFSSSAAPDDVHEAYRSQAAGYIQKPQELHEYCAAVAGLRRYWTQTVLLPAA